MPHNLLHLTRVDKNECVIIHADEIRQIEPFESGSKVQTRTGVMMVDESPSLIMLSYHGMMIPDFVELALDETWAKETDSHPAPAAIATKVRPNLKDLDDKNISVRARCIAGSAYPIDLPDDVDNETVPLTPLLVITEAEWAAKRNSTPEVAQQIMQALREITAEHNSRLAADRAVEADDYE